jgi:hypothetical protein
MRRICLGLMLLGVVSLTGCRSAPCDRFREGEFAKVWHPSVMRNGGSPTATLFDRYPGRYHASDFTDRSCWPSVDSYYTPGEVITYYERFVDHQGRNFDNDYGTYRRSESIRSSIGYR